MPFLGRGVAKCTGVCGEEWGEGGAQVARKEEGKKEDVEISVVLESRREQGYCDSKTGAG